MAAQRRHETGFSLLGQSFSAPQPEPGLYLVATPIGNLGDITLRALQVIAGADVLACEDTRVTGKLLQRFAIRRPTMAYHEHNARAAGPEILDLLRAGKSVAIVSDAGTPLVSDPGFDLVRAAVEAGLPVIPLPGPSATLAALAVSGLPTDAFFFAGFLPSKAGARQARLDALARIPGTLVLFEAPHRIAESLAEMASALGPRPAAICRELTKLHETIYRGTLDALAAQFAAMDSIKGEIVVCVGGPEAPAQLDADSVDTILAGLMAEMKPAKAAQEAARLTGLPRRDLYQRALALKGDAA
ncbi:16S rRNA (cytidine(1402)-2'-O)-methyltransferase [Aureimonas frigidaquae]|uniref:16S rRNA (cytidine(1402)-2'-O)-methyltransferase n=1 Tax=Aureimonas frigidaquae TaxID=424757 RepID=UPI0007854D53|nr:16S rRNA (cytidine(1402)-2'-O)-methyltransferase [Aureimonas frigidaquae]